MKKKESMLDFAQEDTKRERRDSWVWVPADCMNYVRAMEGYMVDGVIEFDDEANMSKVKLREVV